MRDYNIWTDLLIMSIPLAGIAVALLACKVNSWLSGDKNQEVGRG